MSEWHLIENSQDIEKFQKDTNGLHDAYLCSVQYEHCGMKPGNRVICPEMTRLTIRFMVTSIWDAMVEMVFDSIVEWQIKDCGGDLFGCSLSLEPKGLVVWADDYSTAPDVRKNGSYVVAQSLKWRVLAQDE